jgi:hypothetical protein
MRTLLRGVSIVAVVLGLCSFLPASLAQTSNGTISGHLIDKSGASVPDAKVTVKSTDRGDTHETATDGAGAYRIESLLPGTYTVLFHKAGFADLEVAGLLVKGSLEVTADGTLEIAGQSQTIVVESGAGQELQTQSGDLSGNISVAEVVNLPIGSQNPIELVVTQPGVSEPTVGGFSNGFNFSVNGERPRANNFLIDGQDNNDNAINGQAFQTTNQEAIAEVSILQNSYSAEFGRGGGSVTNEIIKGGTNQWHGSAVEIHQNSAVSAIPADAKLAGVTKNPVNIQNTFGFSLGGPVVKDKLFFFVSPEWFRQRSTANGSTLTLPTANGVATLQSLGPNPNVAYLINSLGGLVGTQPFPDTGTFQDVPLNGGRPAVEFGLVQRSGVGEVSNDRQIYSRVDWNATNRDTVSFHYIRDDNVLTPDFFNFPGSLPPYDSQQGGNVNIGGFSFTHTFTPNLLNELRASYNGIDFSFAPTGATAANPLSSMPAATIAGISATFPTLGFPTGLPQGRAHKTYQFQELFSATFGHHTIRAGGDFSLIKVKDAIPFNSRGTLAYNSGGGFSALGNFVDDFSGISGSAQIVFGNPLLEPNIYTLAPYVEDTWRIRSNFTATLGLRYEYFDTPENLLPFAAIQGSLGFGVPGAVFPDSFAFKQKADKNNFGPRIGLAYTPHAMKWLFGDGKTVLRAGYGMFYDVLFTNVLDNTGAAQPNAQGGFVQGTKGENAGRGLAGLSGQLSTLGPILNPFGGITTVAGNLVNPLSHQWNANVQREIAGDFIFTVAYVGTRGERLFLNQEYNPRVDFGARLNPGFGPITVRTNAADSIYHSLQVKVEHKFAKNFLLVGAYTFSKLISDGDEVFAISGASTTSFQQNELSPAGDRGRSVYDHTHVATIAWLWDMPYVHRTNGAFKVLSWATRDWEWTGRVTFETGSPGNVTSGVDTNGDGRGTNDRPNLGNPTAPFTSAAVDGANPNFGITATPGTFFEIQNAIACDNVTIPCVPVDPTKFHWIIPASGLGGVGRNTVVTPGFQTWNMGIQRSFKFTERHKLQFRAEFYNAFNHPNEGNPNSPEALTLTNPDFGDKTSTRFGGRTIRGWLRYSF